LQRRVILLAALLAACGGAPDGPVAVITPAAGGAPVTVALEVAADPVTRQQGLMWRKELPQGQGMLFVFDDDRDHTFWLKNTLIPLDMVFIAREGPTTGRVVGIRPDAKPHSTASLGVGRPSRWVLEVPGGYAARHGLREGDRVELHGVGG
jgi:uncharacterized membrane protein (UPF0127 family)